MKTLLVPVSPPMKALVKVAPAAERLVVEALVNTEEEAKMFCENVFRNLVALAPSEREISVVGRMSAATLRMPLIRVVPVTLREARVAPVEAEI